MNEVGLDFSVLIDLDSMIFSHIFEMRTLLALNSSSNIISVGIGIVHGDYSISRAGIPEQ